MFGSCLVENRYDRQGRKREIGQPHGSQPPQTRPATALASARHRAPDGASRLAMLEGRRRRASAELLKWMDEHSTRLYLSVVTVAEIEDGIPKARRERARRKAIDLAAWLETLLHLYGNRVLPFDVTCAALPESYRIWPAAEALLPDSLTSSLVRRPTAIN